MVKKYDYKTVIVNNLFDSGHSHYWHENAKKHLSVNERVEFDLNDLSKEGWDFVESFALSGGDSSTRMFVFKRLTSESKAYNEELTGFLTGDN